MGLKEESGFFSVAAPAAQRVGGRLGEQQGALFFLTSLYPSAQGNQAHRQQRSAFFFSSACSLGCWQPWGVTQALRSKSPWLSSSRGCRLAGSSGVPWEGVSVLAVEELGEMSSSEVRLAIAGYTGWILGQGRGQPCDAPCTAVPPSLPASPSAQAAAPCENSPYGSRFSGDVLGNWPHGSRSSGGLLGASRGCSPPTPGSSAGSSGEPAARRLGADCDSSPVTTSFTLCVASEQPAGCNYRLGLFRAVIAAGQHVQQVDSRRRRDSFCKCSFSGSSFCTAVDRECRLTRKAALRESFLILFYDVGEKRSSSCMKYDGEARIPLPGLVGRGSSVSEESRSSGTSTLRGLGKLWIPS